MKLNELLTKIFQQTGPTTLPNGISDYILLPEHIELFKEELEKCDEFRGKTILPIKEIVSGRPTRVVTGHDDDGVPIMTVKVDIKTPEGDEVVTVKWGGVKFKQIVNIHSISLTPEMFEPDEILKGEHGGIKVTSNINPETFTPLKQIIISWSPEKVQDMALGSFAGVMEEKAKNDKKEEFTITDDDDMSNATDKALDMAVNLDREEFNKFSTEKYEEWVDNLTSEVIDIMMKIPNIDDKYKVQGKRGIMIRLSKDSMDGGDENFNKSDSYVML